MFLLTWAIPEFIPGREVRELEKTSVDVFGFRWEKDAIDHFSLLGPFNAKLSFIRTRKTSFSLCHHCLLILCRGACTPPGRRGGQTQGPARWEGDKAEGEPRHRGSEGQQAL